MADTNVNVTPGTGGPNIDLQGLDNGNARQSVCIGNATANATVAPVDSTEGLYAISRRDIPANRTRVILSADAIASVAAEAMVTFQSDKAGTVATGITSYTVTTGKTFRVQSLSFKIRPATPSTTVTFANTSLRFREGALITSPLVAILSALMVTNLDSNPQVLTFSDGLEFPSATVLGFSHLASAATVLENFILVGYEY